MLQNQKAETEAFLKASGRRQGGRRRSAAGQAVVLTALKGVMAPQVLKELWVDYDYKLVLRNDVVALMAQKASWILERGAIKAPAEVATPRHCAARSPTASSGACRRTPSRSPRNSIMGLAAHCRTGGRHHSGVVRHRRPLDQPSVSTLVVGQADIAISNLEMTLTNETVPVRKLVTRKAAADVGATSTCWASTCLSVANNHTVDFGWPGLRATAEALTAGGAKVVGAGATRQKAAAPLIKRVAGRRVGIVAFPA